MVIDDVIVRKGDRNVELDVRVRNPDDGTANLTRAWLDVISRVPLASVPQSSANYDLLLGDGNALLPIAHTLQKGEIDRFMIRVGFTPFNTSCVFTATLVIRYNKTETAVSAPFSFDSVFRNSVFG